MLQSSGLFERLAKIQKSLQNIGEKSQTGNVPELEIEPFVHPMDGKLFRSGTMPVVIDCSSLRPAHLVTYRYGVSLLELLTRHGFSAVNLLLASSLPLASDIMNNIYAGNAFKNSMFFEASSSTLFIRVEYLQSVGDFVVCILHSIAHVESGETYDDFSHRFVSTFYRAVRVCMEELFFRKMHYQSSESLPALLERNLQANLTILKKSSVVQRHLDLDVSSPDHSQIQISVHQLLEKGVSMSLGCSFPQETKLLQQKVSKIQVRNFHNPDATGDKRRRKSESVHDRIKSIDDRLLALEPELHEATQTSMEVSSKMEAPSLHPSDQMYSLLEKSQLILLSTVCS